MNRDLAIEAHGLTRRFGSFTAVDDAHIEVARSSIYGFLGPNGAGKSTAIRMLTGLLKPTRGSIRIQGVDVRAQPERAKRHIGYMTQHFSLYEDLTLKENMDFYAGVYGGRPRKRAELTDRLGLGPYLDRLASDVPGGIRQKLSLSCVLMHEPPVLFLDEPTAGVDPVSRRGFWDIIGGLSHEGTTVFLTTHFLDEAEYCHELGFISAGRVMTGGTPRQLRRRYSDVRLFELRTSRYAQAQEALEGWEHVEDVYLHGPRVHVFVDEGTEEDEIHGFLSKRGIHLDSISGISPSMEDIFIMLTHETRSRENGS